MEPLLFIVIGIATIVAVASFAPKIGVATPLILVVVGIGFSYVPGVPEIEVGPEVILAGLLPPLLYSAAITVPVMDFRRNLGSISALSVGLVVVSTVVTGLIIYSLFPALNLAGALALGAVISPPDVVAATAIGRRLGLPPRLLTILEGEGLVNDATALVILRSAIAAGVVTASGADFDGWLAVGDFAFAVIAAIVVGLVVGIATVWVRSRLSSPVLDTVVSFGVPFFAFLPAQEIGASGVIAVVVAGLYSGHHGVRAFTPQARIAEQLNWRTIQFVVENGVFLLIGLEIRALIADVQADDLSAMSAIWIGLLCAAVLAVVRFAFIAPLVVALRRANARAEKSHMRWGDRMRHFVGITVANEHQQRRVDRVKQSFERRTNDIAQLRAEGLGWRGGVVLSWAGMRGVVTLAAAQTLPVDTPYRPQLVLIAFTVAISTLLVQGSTLPLVIRLTRIRDSDVAAGRRELATLLDELGAAGIAELETTSLDLPDDELVDEAVIDRVRHDTLINATSAWERADEERDGLARSPHGQYRALRLRVLRAERTALLEARSLGGYSSRTLRIAQSMLDLEETRLVQIDNQGSA